MSLRGRPETLFLPSRTTSSVIDLGPDRHIAWTTTTGLGGRIWRYELHRTDGATLERIAALLET